MTFQLSAKAFHAAAEIRLEIVAGRDQLYKYSEFNPLQTIVPFGAIAGFITGLTKRKEGRKALRTELASKPAHIRAAWELTEEVWKRHRQNKGAKSTRNGWLDRARLAEMPSRIVARLLELYPDAPRDKKAMTALLDYTIGNLATPSRAFGPLTRLRELQPFKATCRKSAQSDEYDRHRKSLATLVRRHFR